MVLHKYSRIIKRTQQPQQVADDPPVRSLAVGKQGYVRTGSRLFRMLAILLVGPLLLAFFLMGWMPRLYKQGNEPYPTQKHETKSDVELSASVSGVFPQGCIWREVSGMGSSEVTYQYWDNGTNHWTEDQPQVCVPQALEGPPKLPPDTASPRSEVDPRRHYLLCKNIWYNNGKWYVLVDGPEYVKSIKISRNHQLVALHVKNASMFAASVPWRCIAGQTLLFDYIYFQHPTAIGHWWELVGPLFSVLKGLTFCRPCAQLVLLHLQRGHLMEWVRSMLAVALGVNPGGHLPTIWLQKDTRGNSTSVPGAGGRWSS